MKLEPIVKFRKRSGRLLQTRFFRCYEMLKKKRFIFRTQTRTVLTDFVYDQIIFSDSFLYRNNFCHSVSTVIDRNMYSLFSLGPFHFPVMNGWDRRFRLTGINPVNFLNNRHVWPRLSAFNVAHCNDLTHSVKRVFQCSVTEYQYQLIVNSIISKHYKTAIEWKNSKVSKRLGVVFQISRKLAVFNCRKSVLVSCVPSWQILYTMWDYSQANYRVDTCEYPCFIYTFNRRW